MMLGPAAAQPAAPSLNPDTVRAGRFDFGKMWTFEYPPVQYFEETYGFRPDTAWFNHARLASLRIPGCSASFVSPGGLIATNHHCGRSSVSAVARPGENLLDNGFFAPSLADERPVRGYYADQLIRVVDVTDEMDAALQGFTSDTERSRARQAAIARIESRMRAEAATTADSIIVQVVSLYNGGRYSAYTFRRYTDLRLVMAPELQLGFFGGDADNFTFPRYDLDFTLFRAYGRDGKPVRPTHYFKFSTEGVSEGDVVFVVGNPGSTTRLETVAQLEFRRDVQGRAMLDMIGARVDALQTFLNEEREEAERLGIRNRIFGLTNMQKSSAGRQAALDDPYIMARKAAAERDFRGRLQTDPRLQQQYGTLVDEMAAVQAEKARYAAAIRAFASLGAPAFSSSVERRAFLAADYLALSSGGQGGPEIEAARKTLLAVPLQHRSIDQRFLTARLGEIERGLGREHPVTQAILNGRTPAQAAEAILNGTVLADSVTTARALAAGKLTMNDPAVRFAAAILPEYRAYQRAFSELTAREQELASRIGRARFEVYGTAVPPDATFSLRLTDGVVRGYPYNGTLAPAYTTFYGLFDRYHSFGRGTEWDLPQRWLNLPASFDRSTPLNFVSTSDTIGGNSGSPIVNRKLELLGLNFDRNVEGLSRDYIYLPERGRNMGVDVRAILESLDDVYDADRLVTELTTGRVVSETQAPD